MDLGTLGTVSARQPFQRSVFDPLLGIANWTLFVAAVFALRKIPARFQLLLLSVIVYLAWMLIINRLHFVYWQQRHGYLFLFDVLFFWFAGSTLLRPLLLRLRPVYAFAIEVALLLLSIGLHVLIYGVSWSTHHILLVITLLFFTTVGARRLFVRARRKYHGDRVKTALHFSLAFVLPAAFAAGTYAAYVYTWQIIVDYRHRFDWYMFTRYVLDAALYAGCYLLVVVPLTVFVLKHPAYQRRAGSSEPCRTEGSAVGQVSTD